MWISMSTTGPNSSVTCTARQQGSTAGRPLACLDSVSTDDFISNRSRENLYEAGSFRCSRSWYSRRSSRSRREEQAAERARERAREIARANEAATAPPSATETIDLEAQDGEDGDGAALAPPSDHDSSSDDDCGLDFS